LQLIARENYGIEPGSTEDRAVGCLVGLAVGDALGSAVEFKQRGTFPHVTGMQGGGPFDLNPGEWTDDTSMAIALGEALLEDPHLNDPGKLMTRWYRWYRGGDYSHNGRCFDIGGQTSSALRKWQATGGRLPELTEKAGNGGIMRLAPAAVRWWKHASIADAVARRQSGLTHNNLACSNYAGRLAVILAKGIPEGPSGAVSAMDTNIGTRPIKLVKSTGYVLDTFEAACWAVAQRGSFAYSVLKAVNLGDDADTVGAVTGQIAGAAYGLSAIPREWLEVLAWRDRIIQLGRDLYEAGA
jgi:ADP-ribosyl-[dinitrogen reductase] hydrolase